MADKEVRPLTSSEDTSNNSSATTSRRHSFSRQRNGNKHGQKVKFSNVAGVEGEDATAGESPADAQNTPTFNLPEIRLPPSEDVADHHLTPSDWEGRTTAAAALAQNRASRLANRLSNSHTQSRPRSRAHTPQSTTPQGKSTSDGSGLLRLANPLFWTGYASPDSSPPTKPLGDWIDNVDDIPLSSLDKDNRPYTIDDDTSDDDSDLEARKALSRENENLDEARRLIRTLTTANNASGMQDLPRSGTETPAIDKNLHDLDYVPPPDEYRPGIFGAILSSKLAALQSTGVTFPRFLDDNQSPPSDKYSPNGTQSKSHSRPTSGMHPYSTTSSGRATPSKRPKWYEKETFNQSTGSMATLLAQASITSAATAAPGASGVVPRPHLPRSKSSNSMIATAVDMIKHPGHYFHHKQAHDLQAEEERVINDVAAIIACRKYLKKLARSLMAVGAPSHRLEEYMKTSARALNIDGDFLYLPGSMLVSINDKVTMTTEVTLVRESQFVDLGKFKDVFTVYKCVIHGKYSPEEGLADLDRVMKKRGRHPTWFRILAYGFAAIAVGPFAFSARPMDFAPSFVLGCILGFLQLIVVTRSEQFSHVFEVLASVIISFAARGLGSIYYQGNPLFCFSAIAQSSIALILPGYMVLCAALELQSKSIVSGSVRMVYAIIYSLFLGFGILIGSVIMGLIYPAAQSEVTCNIPPWWDASDLGYKLIFVRFIWVPIFAACLAIINQAKWRQIPAMVLIAIGGYQANFWISTRISKNIQVANAIGAFVIGCMANLYSRFFHGLAAAAMLPAIFVQVPSGLAASGSIVAGVTSADQITGNVTGVSVINNGTAGFLDSDDVYNGTIFNVGYGMIQVAIGISVGLYLSALVVYPIGKRRSGLFSF